MKRQAPHNNHRSLFVYAKKKLESFWTLVAGKRFDHLHHPRGLGVTPNNFIRQQHQELHRMSQGLLLWQKDEHPKQKQRGYQQYIKLKSLPKARMAFLVCWPCWMNASRVEAPRCSEQTFLTYRSEYKERQRETEKHGDHPECPQSS